MSMPSAQGTAGGREETPARPRVLGPDPALLANRVGRWRWYWALLGHVMLVALFFGAIMVAATGDVWISALFGRGASMDENAIYTAGRPETFISAILSALAFIVPVMIVLRLVHGQSWRLGLGRDGRFSWSDFAKAAAASFIVVAVFGLIEYAIYPERFGFRSHPLSHLPWVLLAVLVTVPQAFGEDYLFKGYFTRIWGAVLPFRLFVILASAALFSGLHAGNSDVKVDVWFMLISFIAGDILMLVMFLRAGSLGAVTGLHWMNNVVAICLLTRVPGYDNPLALMEYRDTTLLAGKSHLTNPESWFMLIAGYMVLFVLLTWKRSPFHLPYVPPPESPADDAPAAVRENSEPVPPGNGS
ncbi:MAG: hypothetical protein RLZ98_47 [Pseudomonadota bacterium]|jgi:hypothetical protein